MSKPSFGAHPASYSTRNEESLYEGEESGVKYGMKNEFCLLVLHTSMTSGEILIFYNLNLSKKNLMNFSMCLERFSYADAVE